MPTNLGLMREPIKAGFGRRFLALTIDWFMALFIATLVTPKVNGAAQFFPLFIFFIEVCLLTILTQASAGQRLLGLKVVDFTTGGLVSPGRVLARTLMICLVIPAVFLKDGRGYHELFTNSTVVRI